MIDWFEMTFFVGRSQCSVDMKLIFHFKITVHIKCRLIDQSKW